MPTRYCIPKIIFHSKLPLLVPLPVSFPLPGMPSSDFLELPSVPFLWAHANSFLYQQASQGPSCPQESRVLAVCATLVSAFFSCFLSRPSIPHCSTPDLTYPWISPSRYSRTSQESSLRFSLLIQCFLLGTWHPFRCYSKCRDA